MIRDPEVFNKKIEKLTRFYDLSKPRDLFTVVMQEMELAEIRARRIGKNGKDKKEYLMDLVSRIAEAQDIIEFNLCDAASAYIDDMCRASNNEFVINKEVSCSEPFRRS